jgi:hypothetical protein
MGEDALIHKMRDGKREATLEVEEIKTIVRDFFITLFQ